VSATEDDVFIVGVGQHAFGRHAANLSGLDMGERALRSALEDAGTTWSEVDYAVGGSNDSGRPDTLVGRLGLTGTPFVTVRNGCATGGVALATAANALRAGAASLAAVVGFDKHPRGAFASKPADYGLTEDYARSGLMVTTQFFALKTMRYQHEHGITEQTLARTAARSFANAAVHPLAWRRKALSEDEILASPMINDPLRQYMFCSPAEGAVAVILARGRSAFDRCDRPVRVASLAVRSRPFGSFEVFAPWLTPEPTDSPTRHAAKAAFEAAGITPAEVDVAQLQDTDSGSELAHLAETGLCSDGEQEEIVPAGVTDVTGRLPINTDGGCLANGEPIGASGLRQVAEVTRQLQGRALGHQAAGELRYGFTQVYGSPGISACAVLAVEPAGRR
jgi:acetyl-CoA acetyltransferase